MQADDRKQMEQNHLNQMYQKLVTYQTTLEQTLSKLKAEDFQTEKIAYHAGAEDAFDNLSEIQQQNNDLRARDMRLSQLEDSLQKTTDLLHHAYFGKIEMTEQDTTEVESIYIGNATFFDEQQNILIYDWRAPICSLYYEKAVGQAFYQTPNGPVEATLLLKRNINVKEDKVLSIYDIDEDLEQLKAVLDHQPAQYMRPIIATIQKEQNEIIRDLKHPFILVQGCAGSGKTAIILQRIAFLLYQNKNALKNDDILLFSPNDFFSQYISQVLPSLGESELQQMTYRKFVRQQLKRYKITRNSALDIQQQPAVLASLAPYVEALTADQIIFKPILIGEATLFSKNDLKMIFDTTSKELTIYQRFIHFKELLYKKSEHKIRKIMRSPLMESEIQMLSHQTYKQIAGHKEFKSYNEEKEFLARFLKRKEIKQAMQAIEQADFIDFGTQYLNYLAENFPACLAEKQAQFAAQLIAETDATFTLYLKVLMTGIELPKNYQHIFIDEVQDLSVSQMCLLFAIFKRSKFTLVGDKNQAIHQLENHIFFHQEILPQGEKFKEYQLNISYRSTKQITNFTKYLLQNPTAVTPFEREGSLPKVQQYQAEDSWKQVLLATLTKQMETHSSIALIAKTKAEAQALFDALATTSLKDEIEQVKKKQKMFEKPITILSIIQAKGLEFDAVVVANASEADYHNEKDRLLLYTACSRARQQLTLFICGKETTFLQQVPEQYFQLVEE
ncbi:HelD family protein [Isobaculum melis]|uniref:UvrD-like helicase C-terminal domain-containing protein n=1 Tax=Isobaculum melis TaxID=142588 RepID=A0A1H9ST95_9LACT|nr:UvrD-helicase domain-containing protein [Isobaculum melis]SER88121.1 UvrD-like helicase C-terminal domain-containing protein [Isobaculum melis]